MSIENELKIIPMQEIKTEDMLKVLAKEGYKIEGELKQSKQEDTYYDNEKTLLKKGCSFRIRRKGDKAIVTCKIPVKSDTEYKQREEYETEIPKNYIKEDGRVSINDAKKALLEKYPNIELPEDLQVKVKVKNNRNKVNLIAQDGTVIELAFDDLETEDADGNKFKMRNEIEGEIVSGNPENLQRLSEIIGKNYKNIRKNELSKYARALKEMNSQRGNLTHEEIQICVILSKIISSKEFETLTGKGQMIHDFRGLLNAKNEIELPENLRLDNFKDPKYLISKISEARRTKDNFSGKIKTLEDMFLCFLSRMDYKDMEPKLIRFLNENYYADDKSITNRMLHSQQVMLITGLICNSKAIKLIDKKELQCMTSALVHDIGHVPGSHTTEEILKDMDGFFSHEINGRNVIEKIIEENFTQIVDEVKECYEMIEKEYVEEDIPKDIERIKEEIEKSVEAHSRTNSEKRGDGTVVQIPREADKIAYATSDIVDILKREESREEILKELGQKPPENLVKTEFFPEKWKNDIIDKPGSWDEIKRKIRDIINRIESNIHEGNFGKIAVDFANTLRENTKDSITYYDIEQDNWDFLNDMIKYVKELRKEGKHELGAERAEGKIAKMDSKKRLQLATQIFTIKKFNEILKNSNMSTDEAWEKAVEEITKSTDADILNCINFIKEELIATKREMRDLFAEGEMLDETKLKNLNNSDRQIKLQPKGRFELIDIQPYLGENYTVYKAENIRDTYYKNEPGISVCLREYTDTAKRKLIIKRDRNKKGVTQVEREKYETDEMENVDTNRLMEMIKRKYPDIALRFSTKEIRCVIETQRNKARNENGVLITSDKSAVVLGNGKRKALPKQMEISIDKNDQKLLKRIKNKINEFLKTQGLTMNDVITKETKEEQAMKTIKEFEQER